LCMGFIVEVDAIFVVVLVKLKSLPESVLHCSRVTSSPRWWRLRRHRKQCWDPVVSQDPMESLIGLLVDSSEFVFQLRLERFHICDPFSSFFLRLSLRVSAQGTYRIFGFLNPLRQSLSWNHMRPKECGKSRTNKFWFMDEMGGCGSSNRW
jgi:hypothetical protein